MRSYLENLATGEGGETITHLHLSFQDLEGQNIGPFQRIDGLELFPDLQFLDLSGHELLRISGLAALSQLKSLTLAQNQIERIQGLDAASHLEFLDLTLNQISRLEGLNKAVQLSQLELAHNRIHSLEGVGILPNLQHLSLSGNRSLRDTNGLNSFPNLRHLYLVRCPIQNWKGLQSLSHLVELSASASGFSGLDAFSALESLVQLHLHLHEWAGPFPLPPAKNLRKLSLFFGQKPCFPAGGGLFEQLTDLSLSGTGGTDLGFLEEFPSLHHLYLENIKPEALTTLKPGAGLKTIQIHRIPVGTDLLEKLKQNFPSIEISEK